MWNWEELSDKEVETDDTLGSDDDDDAEERDDPNDTSPSMSSGPGNNQIDGPVVTHSVIFKCMGTVKERKYQLELLAAAISLKIRNGKTVPLRLRPEPNNPKDSNAIAIDCQIESDWERIGYIVHEALNGVHHAIQCDSIVSVKFEWVKYKTHWSRSAPGWYCGIAITKKGNWPAEVVQCRSKF